MLMVSKEFVDESRCRHDDREQKRCTTCTMLCCSECNLQYHDIWGDQDCFSKMSYHYRWDKYCLKDGHTTENNNWNCPHKAFGLHMKRFNKLYGEKEEDKDNE